MNEWSGCKRRRQPAGAQARDERGQSLLPGGRPGPTTTAGSAGQNEEQDDG